MCSAADCKSIRTANTAAAEQEHSVDEMPQPAHKNVTFECCGRAGIRPFAWEAEFWTDTFRNQIQYN